MNVAHSGFRVALHSAKEAASRIETKNLVMPGCVMRRAPPDRNCESKIS